MPEREIALLDACSLINLYATRQIEAILASHPDSFAVVDTVRRESGYVFRGGNGPGATEQEPIDLGPLEAAGLLVALTAVSEAELLTYIDLLLEMGDGEAMTGAVAIHRGLTVVTDDRKALRVLTERGVTCETSLDLVKGWIEAEGIAREEQRAILIDIRQRARYLPHRAHPLRGWWDEILS
jgi:hypothetical protein